ncbi:putative sarcosine oxidase [Nostocoides japonicum T1-X7]|uniref:Putative sarcosine oxidase n=1 Tax=Nostocoides japonicum T1-X7 TaxID=1194083 RepID=A0A077LT95_9MICO|nr:FAD-dependent oxidoreductase [Tetrasphaera japonica]CCH76311.1 putative sarcosine oxidase [Tetrasphaera japonica T1-X7]
MTQHAPLLPPSTDTVVVGAGLMGSAVAWHLARRGHGVVVVERFTPANPLGSSHGSARIIRRAYPHIDYIRLTGEAFEWWRELELDSDGPILRLTGGLDHGADRQPRTIASALSRAGVEHDLLSASEAEDRYPGMVFEGPVLYHPQAGTIDAEHAVRALLAGAEAHGAATAQGTEVVAIVDGDDTVRVQTTHGDVRARTVVVAAGAWMPELLAGIVELPPLWVTQHAVFHFPRADPSVTWPVTIHRADMDVYHLPGGRDGGPTDARKIAEHRGAATTARTRSGEVDDGSRRRITEYVRRWLPGLVPDPFGETTCLYTSTQDEDFLIDRIGRVVVVSACSGHGAKLAPVVGRVAADLVEGHPSEPARFGLSRHRERIQPGRRPMTVLP